MFGTHTLAVVSLLASLVSAGMYPATGPVKMLTAKDFKKTLSEEVRPTESNEWHFSANGLLTCRPLQLLHSLLLGAVCVFPRYFVLDRC